MQNVSAQRKHVETVHSFVLMLTGNVHVQVRVYVCIFNICTSVLPVGCPWSIAPAVVRHNTLSVSLCVCLPHRSHFCRFQTKKQGTASPAVPSVVGYKQNSTVHRPTASWLQMLDLRSEQSNTQWAQLRNEIWRLKYYKYPVDLNLTSNDSWYRIKLLLTN
jgi:hypothetical protein